MLATTTLWQVSRLFAHITEVVEEPDTLVFVLIDEVESLTAARKVRCALPYTRACARTRDRDTVLACGHMSLKPRRLRPAIADPCQAIFPR